MKAEALIAPIKPSPEHSDALPHHNGNLRMGVIELRAILFELLEQLTHANQPHTVRIQTHRNHPLSLLSFIRAPEWGSFGQQA